MATYLITLDQYSNSGLESAFLDTYLNTASLLWDVNDSANGTKEKTRSQSVLFLSIYIYVYRCVLEHDSFRHGVEGAALALVGDDRGENLGAVEGPVWIWGT